MSSLPHDIAAIDAQFELLLDLDEAARAARLAEIASGDPALAATLERLLAISDGARTGSLRSGLDAMADESLPPPDLPGYRIERELGRGGMATVYAASREVHGVDEPVAIKLLHGRLLDPLTQERFTGEQRILASLRHPNIARLLDFGTAGGRAYMVMERIEGRPIDAQFEPGRAPVEVVVRAMIALADAVQSAHERLVVHRDIKPQNVIVDASGQPKLIDFGIAKVLQPQQGLLGTATRTGAAPLTLRYASPEQLRGEPVGVGSDIYQLGLLMFHLLSGGWPHDEAEDALPVSRTRADVQPARPSSRVKLDARRRRAIEGDLDAIALRCLRFDPGQRYRSAAELRQDLENHLQHRPVRARRQTRAYLFKGFVLRHRLGVTLGAAAIVLLIGAAVAALAFAQRSREYARSTERLLDTLGEILAPANPYAPSPSRTTVAEAVRRTADRFLGEDLDDPAFQAQVLLRLADMLTVAEQHADVLALAERATRLAAEHRLPAAIAAQAEVRRIDALYLLGRYDEVLERAAALAADTPEAERQRVALRVAGVHAQKGSYREAISVLEPVVAEFALPDPVFRSDAIGALAVAHGSLGDFQRALDMLTGALDLLDADDIEQLPAVLRRRTEIGTAKGRLLRMEEAAAEFEDMLAMVRARLGDAHPMTAKTAMNASIWQQNDERFEDAFQVFGGLPDDAIAEEPIRRAHYLVAKASAALFAGHADQVMAPLLEGVELAQGTLGEDAARLGYFAQQLAWMLFEFGEWELAAAAAEKGHSLSQGRRLINGLILQLLAERGMEIPGWPDAGFQASMPNECHELHYRVLRALLTDTPLPGDTIPATCLPHERARMLGLGLSPGDTPRPSRAQPMRSPLVLRWRATQGLEPAATLPTLDEATRVRALDAINRL